MPTHSENAVTRRWQAVRREIRFQTKSMMRRRVRVLVNLRWRLGDEIMAIPIYESIKTAWPDSELTVSCTYPELLDGNPHVDCVVTEDLSAATPPYDRIINLRDASRTEQRQTHYARLAGVPKPRTRPRVYCKSDAPPIEMDESRGRWIGLSTGATWATKRWPLDAWKSLCEGLTDRGFQLVQIGRGDERIGLKQDLVDETTVREASAVLTRCALFMGCDSGLLHLASAVGTPAIGLFGPTDPYIVFDTRDSMTPISNGRPCATCWNGPLTMREPGVCPRKVVSCMETISVDAVLNAALDMLERSTANRCA